MATIKSTVTTENRINANVSPPSKIVPKNVVLHDVTAASVGLENVDNTSDINKPISTATQTALSTNATDIATNTTDIGTANTNIATNVTNIATNASAISAEITRATAAEGVNATDISTANTNIATNATDIATNVTNIATNATDIATNVTNIGTANTNIATNVTDIATNATAISTETTRATAAEGVNATNIATNVTNIATNATDIATNATDIGTANTNIATNVTDIATNTTNIATNVTDIATKAPINNPTFTGNPQSNAIPSSADHLTNKTYVDDKVASVVDGAPAALDTLNELAAALGDDENFATTTATSIGTANTNIATNVTDIATNATDIGTANTNIATANTNIATNVTDIATNATDIATNATDIGTANTNIATNATGIATANTNIATNATNIATNVTDIGTANTNIATKAPINNPSFTGDVGIGKTATSGVELDVNGDIAASGDFIGLYHKEVAADTESGDASNYYHDSYSGERHLSVFIKNSRADIIRYRDIDNYEYWDGSAWIADSSKIDEVKKLLDGRQDTTYSVPSRDYKFRFTVNASTNYPTAAKVAMQTSWSGSAYPGSKMIVEEYSGSAWETRVTAKFGGVSTALETTDNNCDNWGLNFISTDRLHTGKGSGSQGTRITVDFYGWSPSNASYTTVPLQNLFITSNYSGTENTDYSNLLDYDRNISAPSNLSVSGNITLTGSVDGRDVATDGTKLDAIEAGATTDQTASEILTLIKTVDGAGSGLDADTLDGLSSANIYREIGSASATVGSGWITVAESTNNRRHGEVFVSDSNSGKHSFIRIDWMRSYSDSNFTVINCGGYQNYITGVRVLSQDSDNIYGTKKLQVYVYSNATYRVQINQLQNQSGWGTHTVVTPVVQNSISGYSLHGSQLENLNTYSLASEEGIQAGAGGMKSLGNVDVTGNITASGTATAATPTASTHLTTKAYVDGEVATNVTDIATNATNIATNVTDIATNVTDISTANTNIATNATDIGTANTNIATNASGISTNASAIATNATDIATNAADIATNVTSIGTKAPINNPSFTGDVGIGTTSPEGDLHVVGKTGAAGRIYLNDKDNGATASDALLIFKSGVTSQIINMDTGALNLGGNGQAQLQIVSSNARAYPGINVLGDIVGFGDFTTGTAGSSDKLHFDSANGRLGIGTTTPDFKLDVTGDNGAYTAGDNIIAVFQSSTDHQTALKIKNLNGNSGAAAPRVALDLDVANHETGSGARIRSQLVLRARTASGNGGETAITVPNDLRFLVNNKGTLNDSSGELPSSSSIAGTEAMRISGAGDVGIGTTSPDSILHLSSAGPTVLTIEADTDNVTETDNARIVLKQDGGAVIGRIGFKNNTNSLEFINQIAENVSLGTNNIERLLIDSNGSVGIGTSSPQSKLHIVQASAANDGGIKLTESPTDDNTWSIWQNSSSTLFFQHATTSAGTPSTKAYLTNAGNLNVANNVTAATPTASTHLTTKAYVDAQVAGVVDSAPAALDTLNELAAALGDDENFATTTATSIGTANTNIATNATDIATNVTDIATNATDIATNVTNIATKAPINNPSFTGNVGIGLSSTPSEALDMNGHFRLKISSANRTAGKSVALIKSDDKTAANLRVEGPVAVTHDLFKNSGVDNGFADNSNHFHTVQKINRITQQSGSGTANERVQEQYYAIENNNLKNSKAAFWNWHRVSKEVSSTAVALTNLVGWDVSGIQDSSNRTATSQVLFPTGGAEATTFTFDTAGNNAFTNGDVLRITINIDFEGAIVAATNFGKVTAVSGATATVVLYGGNYKSTDEVADGNSQTALTNNFTVQKIDTTQYMPLASGTGIDVLSDSTRTTTTDTFKITFASAHGLELNDTVSIITDNSGGFQAAEVAFVKSVGSTTEATFVYGRVFEPESRLALSDLAASSVVGVLKGTLDGLHRFTAGDQLMHFNADNEGRYKSYQIGPGSEVGADCIAIGKNVYNKDASTIKIGYDNNMLNIDSAGIDVAGTVNTTGNITAPRLITNEIQCVGTTTGTAQPITYDSKEHRFRDYDETPNNLMVIKKVDGVPIGKVGINHNNPVSALHVVGGHTTGGGIPNEALRVVGSGLFTSTDEIGLVVARDTNNTASTNGGHILKLKQDVSTTSTSNKEELNIGFVGSGGGGIYTNSTPLSAYIDVQNSKSFEIAVGGKKALSLHPTAGYATFSNGALFNGNIVITDKIIHNGDSNTAIRFPANDTVTVETGGAERLRVSASGLVTIAGDLQVNGITTTVNQTNLDVSDNIIGLNRGSSTNTNDSGIIIERGSTGDNAAILWDESEDYFILGTTASDASSTGNIAVTTGNLYATIAKAAQPNITSVGTLTGLSVSGGVVSNALFKLDVPDNGGAPATTAIIDINGYEGRGAGIKIQDSKNSAAGASNREWFIGSGYSQTGFNIGYASDGNQSSYAAQNKLTIDTSGNVGIGTATPTEALDVNGNILSNGVIKAINSAQNVAQLEVGRNSNEFLDIKVSDPDVFITANQDSDSNAAHHFVLDRVFGGTGANDFEIRKGGTAQVTVDTDGNVGIGVTAPTSRLHIKKTSGGNVVRQLRLQNDSTGAGTGTGIAFTNSTSETFESATIDSVRATSNADGNLVFSTASSSSSGVIERMRINALGEVGIGKTATAGVELDVAGDIAASGTVNAKGFSLNANTFTVVSTTSTLAASTNGLTVILQNTGPITITLPTLAAGHVTTFISETIHGVTFVGDTGIAINSFNGVNTTAGIYAQCQVIYKTTTTAFLGGNLV